MLSDFSKLFTKDEPERSICRARGYALRADASRRLETTKLRWDLSIPWSPPPINARPETITALRLSENLSVVAIASSPQRVLRMGQSRRRPAVPIHPPRRRRTDGIRWDMESGYAAQPDGGHVGDSEKEHHTGEDSEGDEAGEGFAGVDGDGVVAILVYAGVHGAIVVCAAGSIAENETAQEVIPRLLSRRGELQALDLYQRPPDYGVDYW
jgi:hypothetical protein